jgi:chromosome segregation ATPase
MTCIHDCNCLDNKLKGVIVFQAEVSRLQSQLVGRQQQVNVTQNQLEYARQQMITTRSELDEKQDQITNLVGQLSELKLESSEKASGLKLKDDEIKALKKNLEESQKDFLGGKLKSKQEKLKKLEKLEAERN